MVLLDSRLSIQSQDIFLQYTLAYLLIEEFLWRLLRYSVSTNWCVVCSSADKARTFKPVSVSSKLWSLKASHMQDRWWGWESGKDEYPFLLSDKTWQRDDEDLRQEYQTVLECLLFLLLCSIAYSRHAFLYLCRRVCFTEYLFLCIVFIIFQTGRSEWHDKVNRLFRVLMEIQWEAVFSSRLIHS